MRSSWYSSRGVVYVAAANPGPTAGSPTASRLMRLAAER